jgi:hypothetical protein
VNWSLKQNGTKESGVALLCMSSKMAAAIALLLVFVMKNKHGCVTHRLWGFLSYTTLLVFILRHCFFAYPPPPVLLFVSFFLFHYPVL